MRLSQMQDIVGCRVVVNDLTDQNQAIERICARFPEYQIDDRREHHQNGYRAVHFIVRLTNGNTVEVQIRTVCQNSWANTCERLADTFDPAFKYGGGSVELREPLMALSEKLDTAIVIVASGLASIRAMLSEAQDHDDYDQIDMRLTEVEQEIAAAQAAHRDSELLGKQLADALVSNTQ